MGRVGPDLPGHRHAGGVAAPPGRDERRARSTAPSSRRSGRPPARQFLRPNAVDTLTGKNTGNGAGRAIPYLHFEEWEQPELEVRMILKGAAARTAAPSTGCRTAA